MVRHHSLEVWEKNLKKVLDDLDDLLENQFGNKYALHPARPKRGKTANKAQDGLFNIVASFTLGTGSELGKGYVVDVHMSTLENVPANVQKEIEIITLKKLGESLPSLFPGKNLKVSKDGSIIKIHGDLSLGSL